MWPQIIGNYSHCGVIYMSPLLESGWSYDYIGQEFIAEMVPKWLPKVDPKNFMPYYVFLEYSLSRCMLIGHSLWAPNHHTVGISINNLS